MSKDLITLEDAGKSIDAIVSRCAPLAMESANFSSALAVADGIKHLRMIFTTHPGIKETVEAMQNTRLGFLTDRTPKSIAASKAQGKTLTAYTYEEVAEACIEAMIKGFRITNNEFNIIAGNFYPAKNGKYRKIIEYPGITDFQFTTTSPIYEADNKAKVQAYASWCKDGIKQSLGISAPDKGIQDTQVFKIRVNAYMGEDAIIGKAHSKLFSRVLERITGKVQPEATDLEFGGGVVVDMETVEEKTLTKAEALKGKLREAKKQEISTSESDKKTAPVCPLDGSLPITVEGCVFCTEHDKCPVAKEVITT